MGLDIAFNRQEALKAGIEIKIVWEDYTKYGGEAGEKEIVRVPDMVGYDRHPIYTLNGGKADDIIVRANKWGSIYEPLTEWLEENGIKWSEF